jgi:hypothetical protein
MAAAGEPDRPPTGAAAEVQDAGTGRQQLLEGAAVQLLLDGALVGVVQPVPFALAASVVIGADRVERIAVGRQPFTESAGSPARRATAK